MKKRMTNASPFISMVARPDLRLASSAPKSLAPAGRRQAWVDPLAERMAAGPSMAWIAGAAAFKPLGTIPSGMGRDRQFGTVAGYSPFEGMEFELLDDGRPVVDLQPGRYFLHFAGEREPLRYAPEDDEDGNPVVDQWGDKYREVRPWPLGTFERLTNRKPAGRLAAWSPRDLLAEYGRACGLRDPYSPAAWERFAAKSGVLLGDDGTRWYDRRLPIGNVVDAVLDAAQPLILAQRAGTVPLCEVDGCKPESHPARTVAAGGVLWCGEPPAKAPKGARPERSLVSKLRTALAGG